MTPKVSIRRAMLSGEIDENQSVFLFLVYFLECC